jgi:hypothetical protein
MRTGGSETTTARLVCSQQTMFSLTSRRNEHVQVLVQSETHEYHWTVGVGSQKLQYYIATGSNIWELWPESKE